MNRYILVIAIILLPLIPKAQHFSNPAFYSTRFGINTNFVNTGSNNKIYSSIGITIQKGKKNYEIGPLVDFKNFKISGLNFRHRIFLGYFDEELFTKKMIRSFFQYSFFYKKMGKYGLQLESENYKIDIDKKLSVQSVEHYFSYGIQMKLNRSTFIESSIGIGIYMNSQKTNNPGTIGLHDENFGIVPSVRFGIGNMF